MKNKLPFMLILTGVILSFQVICQRNLSAKNANDNQNKIILIGIDGATWKVIWPLIHEGKLPHIAGLIKDGSWGVLLSESPMYSSSLWTSIATGKKRENHGIINMVKKETPTTLIAKTEKTRENKSVLSSLSADL